MGAIFMGRQTGPEGFPLWITSTRRLAAKEANPRQQVSGCLVVVPSLLFLFSPCPTATAKPATKALGTRAHPPSHPQRHAATAFPEKAKTNSNPSLPPPRSPTPPPQRIRPPPPPKTLARPTQIQLPLQSQSSRPPCPGRGALLQSLIDSPACRIDGPPPQIKTRIFLCFWYHQV